MRELSTEEAKDLILDYFIAHPGSYPSDCAEELGLDAVWVKELCDELETDGYLQ